MARRTQRLLTLVASALLVAGCSSTPAAENADGASTASTSSSSEAPASSTSPAAALTGGAPVANDPAMTAEGPKAPDFTLPLVEGGQASLSDYAGKKVVLIDFWSTTCDPCMVEMPHLVELYKKYKDRGLIVLAVSLDGPESLAQVNSVIHDKGMTFPVLLDEETTVVSRYNPKKEMPFSAVVAKNGAITYKHGGYTAGDENKLADAIAKLIP